MRLTVHAAEPEHARSRNDCRGIVPGTSPSKRDGGAVRTVILAGGSGSRLSEETVDKPKPMVEIGTHPILWHIMKIYANYGFCDFVIPLGYKGEVSSATSPSTPSLAGDMTVEMARGTVEQHRRTNRGLDGPAVRHGPRHGDRRADAPGPGASSTRRS